MGDPPRTLPCFSVVAVMDPHPIRLRGPWTYSLESSAATELSTGRLKIPDEWLAWCHAVCGCRESIVKVVFQRRFGKPTGLTPQDKVELVVDGELLIDEVLVNNVAIARNTTYLRADIVRLLNESNELTLRITLQAKCYDFPDVRLEISAEP